MLQQPVAAQGEGPRGRGHDQGNNALCGGLAGPGGGGGPQNKDASAAAKKGTLQPSKEEKHTIIPQYGRSSLKSLQERPSRSEWRTFSKTR